MHPELTDEDVSAIAHAIATVLILKAASHRTDDNNASDGQPSDECPKPFVVVGEDNTQFVNIKGKFINVDELDFSLIGSINPFAQAYQFVSKIIEPELLKRLQEQVAQMREKMTMQKAFFGHIYVDLYRIIKESQNLIPIMTLKNALL